MTPAPRGWDFPDLLQTWEDVLGSQRGEWLPSILRGTRVESGQLHGPQAASVTLGTPPWARSLSFHSTLGCHSLWRVGRRGCQAWGEGAEIEWPRDKGQPVPVTGKQRSTPGTSNTPGTGRDSKVGRGGWGEGPRPCVRGRPFNPRFTLWALFLEREEGRLQRRATARSLCPLRWLRPN